MIELTKLNGSKLVINSDLVEFIEASPDTLITLTTGTKIMVQEKIPEIINAIVHFRRLIRDGVGFSGLNSPVSGSRGLESNQEVDEEDDLSSSHS